MPAKLLIIDGNNLLHRARSGFTLGEHFVGFNFFRGFRALVEKLKPNRTVMVLDGAPKKRLELLPEYKANRALDATSDDPRVKQKLVELADFRIQARRVVDLLSEHFPITVMHHPDIEADDIVAYLCTSAWKVVEVTVVSTDTDYIQLLRDHPNVKLYNPVTKEYVKSTGYDYAMWKALRGDPTDNVPGLMTDAKATNLVNDGELFAAWLVEGTNELQLRRNLELIKFHELSINEVAAINSSTPKRDWDAVKARFVEWGFASIVKPASWDKFVATFDILWGQAAKKES